MSTLRNLWLNDVLKPGLDAPVHDGRLIVHDVPVNIQPNLLPSKKGEWTWWRRTNYEFLKKRLPGISNSGSILLDVGAGPSQFLDVLKTCKLISCDIYPYQEIDVVCDLSRTNIFKPNSIDVIHLSNVLEHIEKPKEFVDSLNSILKPGGSIIAMVPFLLAIHQAPYDFHRYTEFGLKALMKNSGFEIAHFETFGDAMTLSSEYAWLAKKEFDRLPGGMLKSFVSFLLRLGASFLTRVNQFSRKAMKIPELNSRMVGTAPYGYMFVAKKKN